MPQTAEDLLKQLPGVGRYTAAAVGSIALGQVGEEKQMCVLAAACVSLDQRKPKPVQLVTVMQSILQICLFFLNLIKCT